MGAAELVWRIPHSVNVGGEERTSIPADGDSILFSYAENVIF